MHDQRARRRSVSNVLDSFERVLTRQNEVWFRVLRGVAAGGYTTRQWVTDVSDFVQFSYREIRGQAPSGAKSAAAAANPPSVLFDLDADAESADAQLLTLPQPLAASVEATPLRALDGAAVPRGPRVTLNFTAGEVRMFVGLAGLRKLGSGRYLSVLQDAAGRVIGLVYVQRA